MEDLLNHFFNDIKQQRVPAYDKYNIAFVLDGLEQCQLHLDFENNKDLSDIKERASMDVLLTNLIKGNLLPSSRLWIISQPSGVDKIPPGYIQRVTECQETEEAIKQRLRKHLQRRIVKDYEDEESKQESHTDLYEIKTLKDTEDKKTLEKVKSKEIFGSSQKNKVRTVLMEGVAGIGKTFKSRKFMVDWAKQRSNTDIDLIVPFDFSDLNSRRDKVQSMEDLLNHFFNDIKQQRVPAYDKYNIAFVLDGLEQCQLHLDFENNKDLSDIKERASMDVLLTNLIKGNLLPSSHLWIISRPSGVDKIPPGYIQRVTECQETSKRRQQLVSSLRERFSREITQVEDTSHPNQKNTEHIIRKVSTDEVNDEDKDGQTVMLLRGGGC
ncbi:NACHT, LRR and PYD domains-containing protein 3-like [Seriola dumerili]|uniref:NACHT, LRR and PYD domains-containing protein 3-like n=1 Tax=Seriola dumerili TaxID=41447 RepID=UPI000BBE2523|nr:NACHT, LRR and PYD domains-containing protein 3-like [Seriola dumerili]